VTWARRTLSLSEGCAERWRHESKRPSQFPRASGNYRKFKRITLTETRIEFRDLAFDR
jgi:hypothetical protein